MNIMINTICNLSCHYCFADKEITTCDTNTMSVENFKMILGVLKENNDSEVRLIGGEPTIHPDFKEFIKMALYDKNIKHIHIFSNMTFGEDIREYLVRANRVKRVTMLPNISTTAMDRLDKNVIDNLKLLLEVNILGRIGINMSKPNMCFDNIKTVLDMGYRMFRWSVVVPNMTTQKGLDVKMYFRSHYDNMINFFTLLNEYGARATLDCNSIPRCAFTPDEIYKLIELNPSLFSERMACEPILDVNPKMEVIRCFGVSDFKIPLDSEFRIEDALQITNNAVALDDTVLFDECFDCATYIFNKGKSCACIAYRKNK
ncbi:MAG: radical SAM protein [Fusobacteriaceae bacterium]